MPATKPSCLYFISESILNSIVLRNLGELAETLGEPSAEGREGGGGRRFVASLAKSARFRKTILYSILSEMKYKEGGLVYWHLR